VKGTARPVFAVVGFCGGCFPWFAWGLGGGSLSPSFLANFLDLFFAFLSCLQGFLGVLLLPFLSRFLLV